VIPLTTDNRQLATGNCFQNPARNLLLEGPNLGSYE
jgi:hypothetical protein